MIGALKFTNLTILQARKPYKLLSGFSSSITTSTVNAVDSRKTPRLKGLVGWWCWETPYARTTNPKISSQGCWSQGPNLPLYTSDCSNQGRQGRLHRRTKNIVGTRMGATVQGKVENDYDESRKYSEKQPVDSSKLLTLPTMLTIARVAAVPLLVGTFYSDSWWEPAATTGIFIVAAITDWLDGYLARKMKMGTQFGAFLDPVADKLMVATALILLCTRPYEAGMFGQAPWLLTVPAIAIIGREITMSAVREWAAAQDRKLLKAVAVNNLGKWKTATQMTALTTLLAARDGSLVGAGTLAPFGVGLLYISAWLSLWSLVVYMRKIWKVLLL